MSFDSSRLTRGAAAAAILTVVTACGAQALPKVDIEVAGHALRVEVADEPEERRVGLMNRRRLGEDRGMIFVFETESRHSFWMKNTRIPLSIAFIASDGTIRQIEDMEPLSLDPVESRRSVPYALEVNQGWFERRGIEVGDRVVFPENWD